MDISLNELAEKGQQIYLDELKDKLEKAHMGEYVVIEVESKKYFVGKDPVTVNEKARKEFPDKLFFMVQIGKLQRPSINLKKDDYAWLF